MKQLLQVFPSHTTILCKSPDDAGSYSNWNSHVDHHGLNTTRLRDGEYGYVAAPCDASGDVDFAASDNDYDIDIWLVGYIP